MIVPGPNILPFRMIRGVLYVWVVVLVLAIWPYTEDPAAPVKEFASAIALLAMVSLWAGALRMANAPYRAMAPPLWFLPVFFGVLVVTALCSGSVARGMESIRPWFVFACIGFIAYQTCPHASELRTLFRVIVASVALSSVYGLVQHFGLDPFPWAQRDVEEYRALPATYGNPNLAGHVLVVALILCAGLAADAWQRARWCLEFALLLGIGALMLTHLRMTHMRGGLVALAVAGFFLTIVLLAHRGKRGPVSACVVALGACALLAGVGVVTALLLGNGADLDSSLQLRLHGYAGAAAMFLDNAFLGVGPGNYAFENIPYWSNFESLWYALEGKRNFHVHNEWLEAAVESGIVGVASLVGLFLFALLTFFENPYFVVHRDRALILALPTALVAVATDACFGFNLHAPVSAALFFLLLSLRPAVPRYSAPTRRNAYRSSLLLSVASVIAAWGAWGDYQHELHYQRAKGAIAWERGQQNAGQLENAAQRSETTFALLRRLEADRPWDYRAPLLLGDFAMSQLRFTEAAEAYERATSLHPHLPRLHVQLARATVRAAQAGKTELGPALDMANVHVSIALAQCPDLAEAWSMRGWVLYLQAQDLGTAIGCFERARARGEVADASMDAVLGELYGARQSWHESASAFARSVTRSPEFSERWTRWEAAARNADPVALANYGQALLHELDRYSTDVPAEKPTLAIGPLATKLSDLAGGEAQAIVVQHALARALEKDPKPLAFWSAWLGTYDAPQRKNALVDWVHLLKAGTVGALPSPVAELAEALESPDRADLATVARAVAQALASPPGGMEGDVGRVHTPLVELLEDLMEESGLGDAMLGTARRDLGAAFMETGHWARAEEILRTVETTLPVAALPPCYYYRSRALAALGQPDAALALAKAAMDAEGGVLEFRWNMALRLADVGRVEAARFVYESLLSSLAPDHPYRAQITREHGELPARSEAP